ncbi:MAG: indole-3-glycerol phosphate synthase TrpC [Catonella sp.]|nr:indole-3-glycerol phosphate synthase TrpC [Catonella sp.]MDY6357351.1 indole-3-glycerol phosphate synthase TrpC [Catonella sp.]
MILDTLRDKAVLRVQAAESELPLEEIKRRAISTPRLEENKFYKNLSRPGMNFICEVKKASPSKGIIAEDFPYLDIAKDYESAGASAISVLTEPEYFLGSEKYLREIANEVSTPLLRKDFTVSEYQIYEAKLLGASAVLLICAILSDEQLKEYGEIAEDLGLSALVEAHDEEEIKRAEAAGAKIIGVNNRNLKDFSVDTGNAGRLRSLVPDDIIFVSESGIKTAEDVKKLYDMGVNAVLVGETLMRAPDKKAKLAELRSLCL